MFSWSVFRCVITGARGLFTLYMEEEEDEEEDDDDDEDG